MKLFMVVVTSAICTLIILWAFTACSIDKQDARLKILEAAKTAAQQPQERHYFVVCDSAVVAGKISK
jgi:uncharacterized alpha/beta hydrolase family protein